MLRLFGISEGPKASTGQAGQGCLCEKEVTRFSGSAAMFVVSVYRLWLGASQTWTIWTAPIRLTKFIPSIQNREEEEIRKQKDSEKERVK